MSFNLLGRNRSSKVSIVRVKGTSVSPEVGRAIDLLGGIDVQDEDHILIKPNLCDLISSQAGATTDPTVVGGIIEYLRRKANPRITIIESDHWVADAETEFKCLGYYDLAEQMGVETKNLSKLPRRRVNIPFPSYYNEISIPEIFFEADVFVSVAKLKTHYFEGISGVLKNQFGCIPQRMKATYHPFLSDIIAALNIMIRPDLSIVDGIVAMEGLGPTGGDPKKLNVILAGFDPVAVDSVIARIAGFSPTEIPHLLKAKNLGVGKFPLDEEVLGDEWEDLCGTLSFIDPIPFQLSKLGLSVKRTQRRTSKILDTIGEYIMMSGLALNSKSLGLREILAFGGGRIIRELKKYKGYL